MKFLTSKIDRGLYEISDFKFNVVSWFIRKLSVTKSTQTLQLTIVFCFHLTSSLDKSQLLVSVVVLNLHYHCPAT